MNATLGLKSTGVLMWTRKMSDGWTCDPLGPHAP